MIYVASARNRKRRKSDHAWYHEEAPWAKIIVVQRPFSHLSVGPIIVNHPEEAIEPSIKEYKKWLFKSLLKFPAARHEFTHILDVLTQEGDIVLQCSCSPSRTCHAMIIKDALEWASQFGIEDWYNQLKRISQKTG